MRKLLEYFRAYQEISVPDSGAVSYLWEIYDYSSREADSHLKPLALCNHIYFGEVEGVDYYRHYCKLLKLVYKTSFLFFSGSLFLNVPVTAATW